MQDNSRRKAASTGVTPFLALAYGAYYVADTFGTRFDTQGYGALCVAALAMLSATLVLRKLWDEDAASRLRNCVAIWSKALRQHTPAVALAAILVVYAAAQTVIGFLSASAIVFAVILVLLRAGGIGRIVLLTIVLTAIAWLTLLQALGVPLPEGWFEL